VSVIDFFMFIGYEVPNFLFPNHRDSFTIDEANEYINNTIVGKGDKDLLYDHSIYNPDIQVGYLLCVHIPSLLKHKDRTIGFLDLIYTLYSKKKFTCLYKTQPTGYVMTTFTVKGDYDVNINSKTWLNEEQVIPAPPSPRPKKHWVLNTLEILFGEDPAAIRVRKNKKLYEAALKLHKK